MCWKRWNFIAEDKSKAWKGRNWDDCSSSVRFFRILPENFAVHYSNHVSGFCDELRKSHTDLLNVSFGSNFKNNCCSYIYTIMYNIWTWYFSKRSKFNANICESIDENFPLSDAQSIQISHISFSLFGLSLQDILEPMKP